MPNSIQVHGGRAFDRLVNFTDGVTAVAITVLVLPIVDLRAQGSEATVWDIISDHFGQLITFVWTFIVIAVMWMVHNRIVSRLAGFDGTVFWLNTMWLLAIAFLPWTSVMYGTGVDGVDTQSDLWSGGEGLGGAGLLYWANMAIASIITTAITWHARRHPELIDQGSQRFFQDNRVTHIRGLIFAGYFMFIGVVSIFAPQIAVWLPMGLIVVGIVLSRQEVKHA
jgi:uncharacterized membrane protein